MKFLKLQCVLICVLILFLSCEEPKKNFYKDKMQSRDLYRLPIIDPYQLITSYCCKSWSFYGGSKNKFKNDFSVDSVNYESGFISFYSQDSSTGWVVFNAKTTELKIFEDNYLNFIKYLDEIKIHAKLYSAEYVHRQWLEDKKLPWKIN